MMQAKAFASRADRVQAMNQALDRELGRIVQRAGSSQGVLLAEMLQYHLGLRGPGAHTGKRLRASIALLVSEALGRRYADAIWAAVAVELVHNFSLVFDDVQDRDELRRGRPSLWKLWGTGQAINAGAALEAMVLRAAIDLLPPRFADRLPPALKLLTDAMLALCQGQVLDLQFEQRVDVSMDEYMHMIRLKTACLFECAARLGSLAAGAGGQTLERAGRFGQHLGVAFQVIDDVLGLWASPMKTGKPAGSDLRNGKKTLPVLFALKSGSVSGRRQLRALLTRARFAQSDLDVIQALLDHANARAYCRRQAAEHLAEARLNLFAIAERPNWAVRALADMVSTLESELS